MAKANLADQNIPTEATSSSARRSPLRKTIGAFIANTWTVCFTNSRRLPTVKDEPDKITHRLRVPPQVGGHPGFYWEG